MGWFCLSIFVGVYWNDYGMVMVGRYVDSLLVVVLEVVEESGILISSSTNHEKKEVKYLLFALKEQMNQLEVQLLEA